MQNEAKLESGPIFDFGGPWWPSGPEFSLEKPIQKWPIHLAMLTKNFRALALIVLAVASEQPGSTLIVARTIITRKLPSPVTLKLVYRGGHVQKDRNRLVLGHI